MEPDKNHIHHKLIGIGFSHKEAVGIIIFTQLIFILFNSYVITNLNLHIQIIINAIIIFILLKFLYKIPDKSVS